LFLLFSPKHREMERERRESEREIERERVESRGREVTEREIRERDRRLDPPWVWCFVASGAKGDDFW
jgi:hypothetical protein